MHLPAIKRWTIEELEAMPDDGHVYDLIDGELRRREPAGFKQGAIGGHIGGQVGHFANEHGLGHILLSNTIYVDRRNPNRSLKPAVSFIRIGRLPTGEAFFLPLSIPPDLAIEICSPNETEAAMEEKIARYLDFGVPLIWIFWPRRKSVTVYAVGQPMRELGAGDELDGGTVLPGFRVAVAEVFRVGR